MSDIKYSEDLVSFLKEHPHVKRVFFTEDGHWHLSAYSKNGKAYSYLDPLNDALSKEIVKNVTREEILGTSAEDVTAETAVD